MTALDTAESGVAAHWLAPARTTEADKAAVWATQLRDHGSGCFSRLAWPSAKHEAWQHSALKKIQDGAWTPAHENDSDTAALEAYLAAHPWNGSRLVFVNGRAAHISVRPSDARALQVIPLVKALQSERTEPDIAGRPGDLSADTTQPFAALNSAWLRDGAVITILAGQTLEAPLQLLFLTVAQDTDTVSHPRVVVDARERSHATIFEQHVSLGSGRHAGRHLSNVVTECHVAAHSEINHTILRDGGPAQVEVNQWMAKVAANGMARCAVVNVGGDITRQEMHVRLAGAHAGCDLTGLNLARGEQHLDTQVTVDHQTTDGTSTQLFKSLLDERAISVFSGRVLVRPHAVKTSARQMSRNVLLSEHAVAYTRPQLEILADDVRCTHGATVGQLQDEAVFYLRSRGLDEATTRRLLTYAHASEALSRIRHRFIHGLCDSRVRLALALEAEASTSGEMT